MYNGILQNLVYGDGAKNVIYQMEKFSMNLVRQQLHMQTAAHIVEYVVYTNYKSHFLKNDVFPIHPVGYEYFKIKTPAQIEDDDGEEVDSDGIKKLGYEVCNWKPQLNDILVCRDIVNNRNWKNNQNELNNEGVENIFNIDSSLLNNIDKMTAVTDPCKLCCWQKDRNPSTVFMCSGAEKLRKFKFEFFAE